MERLEEVEKVKTLIVAIKRWAKYGVYLAGDANEAELSNLVRLADGIDIGKMKESECQEINKLNEKRIAELENVIKEMPECPAHGNLCLPHVTEWIRRVKTLGEIIMGGNK